MQTVNIYFEIWRNSDFCNSSSHQTNSANIIRPQFVRIFGCHGVHLSQSGVVGRGRPSWSISLSLSVKGRIQTADGTKFLVAMELKYVNRGLVMTIEETRPSVVAWSKSTQGHIKLLWLCYDSLVWFWLIIAEKENSKNFLNTLKWCFRWRSVCSKTTCTQKNNKLGQGKYQPV